METLYDRLGVPRDVEADDLKKAWKRIVRTVHPDVGGDTAAFQDLEKAYDVLSHPNTRAFYDMALDIYRPGASRQPMPTKAAVPPPEWIADLGGTTVLPARRRPTRRPAKQAAPEPVPEEHAAVAVDEPVEVVVEPEPEAEPEPTGRHEAAGQPSRGRRTAGIGKRFGSTWKRARAVSVESTRS
ncbi:MAG: DnaJ domain-containing protein [Candidatus Nanopelagicales bacterium]